MIIFAEKGSHPLRSEELLPSQLLIGSRRTLVCPLHQTEVGQEEAVCHTQSAFAQIDPAPRLDLGFLLKREEKDFVKRPEEQEIKSWHIKRVSKS